MATAKPSFRLVVSKIIFTFMYLAPVFPVVCTAAALVPVLSQMCFQSIDGNAQGDSFLVASIVAHCNLFIITHASGGAAPRTN